MKIRIQVLLLLAASFFCASANFISSPVKAVKFLFATRIIDGDTFEARDSLNTYRIRLNGIDAPERGQDFYQLSKKRLGELCKSGPLTVTLFRKDRYGRWIADVVNSRNIDISYCLVGEGLAWHFKKYSKDAVLANLEIKARKAKSGLWQMQNPVAPWVVRKH